MKKKLSRIFDFVAAQCGDGGAIRRRVSARLLPAARGNALAQDALHWLEENKLPVRYDTTLALRGFEGMYRSVQNAKGIHLAPAFNARPPLVALNIFVHEARHAWQDEQGLISTLPVLPVALNEGLLPAFKMLCLEEADAWAHGYAATSRGGAEKIVYELQTHFMEWFAKKPQDYLPSFAQAWLDTMEAIEATALAHGTTAAALLKAGAFGDFAPLAQRLDKGEGLEKLGRAFGGVNYMTAGDFHLAVPAMLLPVAEDVFENMSLPALQKAETVRRRLLPAPAANPSRRRSAPPAR